MPGGGGGFNPGFGGGGPGGAPGGGGRQIYVANVCSLHSPYSLGSNAPPIEMLTLM